MWRSFRLSTTVLLGTATTMAVLATPATGAPEPLVEWDKPSGTSVSFVVVDRQTGQVQVEHAAHTQYRSASLVKLLIALDYVESRAPDAPIPPGDRALLESMLRSSDDEAASELWVRGGWETIVQRMADRLELTDTEPPADRRVWGYTATSAADVARIYEYLLDKADPSVSDVILGNLRMATRCAADGRDQYFGIPTAVDEPWAVKQGWSGYEEVVSGEECHERIGHGMAPEEIPTLRDAAIRAQADRGPDIDLTRRAMHTSGTIGADHNTIMVLLSLHPEGTPYQTSAQQVTAIVRALYLAVKVALPDPVRRWPDVESR